jgi:hypothetical protein
MRLIGTVVKGKPTDPAHRRPLVELVVLSVEPDDPQRVPQADMGQLGCCGFDEGHISRLKGALEARVRGTAAGQCERSWHERQPKLPSASRTDLGGSTIA